MSIKISPFTFQYARSNAGLSLTHELVAKPKQVIWLVGNSGSGKSTFLHLLKGFHPEFLSGSISGDNPNQLSHAAYIAQNPLSQIVHERVGEEFFFAMENVQWTHSDMDAKLHWLEQFGLDMLTVAHTDTLSHGQAQRLLLASILAFGQEWAVFDEPSAFLSPQMRDEFYQILAQLKGQLSMLIIDHHPQVAQIADACWHVADDGVIQTMSVEQWLALEQQQLQHTSDFYQIPAPPQAIELKASHLVVGYCNNLLFEANFRLASGECAVLSGDNGCGKSTFFNTIAGIQKPLSGAITLQTHHQMTQITPFLAYVFQHPDSHFLCDTIEDELRQLGVQDIDASLSAIGLLDRANSSPHQLSEGQKRRLTLLFPCLQQRPLILLDEPTFGQDALNTQRIIRLIDQLKRAGYALIVITHDVSVQNAIATQLWQIESHQLIVSAAA